MSFTPVTITGSYDAPEGGSVQLQLTSPLMQIGGLVVPAVLNQAALLPSTSSAFSLTVFATNDPATIPENIPYRVNEQLSGVAENVYYIIVPYNAPGGTIAISECQRVIPPSADVGTIPESALGTPGGLAILDSNGNVPLEVLNNIEEGTGVDSVSNSDGSLVFSPETGEVIGSLANPFPGPLTMRVSNISGGLVLQFQQGAPTTTSALEVLNSSGSPIFSIPPSGGATMYFDKIGARYGVEGSGIFLDSTTNPPSFLWPSGFRQWEGAGAPTSVITVGPSNVGDLYWNSTSSVQYICTTEGTPGTWEEGSTGGGVTAGAIEGTFTAAGQIFFGTGDGSGELITLLSAIESLFGTAGQLLVGTGDGSGALLNPGTSGYVLTSNGSGSALSWSVLSGGGNMSTSVYDPASIGQQMVGTTAAQTVSDKRFISRVHTVNAPGATPSFDTDTYDVINYTGIAANITTITTSGTPNAGDSFTMYLTDNGTARHIAWGAIFVSTTVTLPTSTVAGVRLHLEFTWNESTSTWECVGVA
jgi:hypothetical protein